MSNSHHYEEVWKGAEWLLRVLKNRGETAERDKVASILAKLYAAIDEAGDAIDDIADALADRQEAEAA